MASRQLFTHSLPQHSGRYICLLISISYFLFQPFASAYSIDILTEEEPNSTEDSSQHFLQEKLLSPFSAYEDEWDEDAGDHSEELASEAFKTAQEEFSRDLRVSDEPLMTIYVSAVHGNDSNNGTEAFPVASLNASLALIPPSFLYYYDFYEDWEQMGNEEEEGDRKGENAFFFPMVVVVIGEGNYTGVRNQNLRLPTGLSFNFTAPSGPDLTIFDAEGQPVYFFERVASPSSFSFSSFHSDTPFATLKKSTKAIFDGLSFRNAGGGAIIWLDKSSTLLLFNTSFINNVLTLPQRVTGSQIGYGGAVTFCTKRIVITQSLFLDNGITANLSSSSFPNLGSGGLSGSTISFYLCNCIFQSNYGLLSPSPSSSVIYSPSGALFLSLVRGTVEASSFVNNSGEWGGFHFWASSRGTFGTNSILYLRNVESTSNRGIKSRLSLWIPAVFQDCTFREDESQQKQSVQAPLFYLSGNGIFHRCSLQNIIGRWFYLSSTLYMRHSLINGTQSEGASERKIYMQLRARVVLEYNVFSGNKGALFGYGELQGPNTFVLIGNWFESNSAPYSTTPLILLSGTKARIENNTFIDNNGGTGIVTVGRGKVQVKNCYFRGNKGNPEIGSLVNIYASGSIEVSDSKFLDNNLPFLYRNRGALLEGMVNITRCEFVSSNNSNDYPYGIGIVNSGVFIIDSSSFVSQLSLRSLVSGIELVAQLIQITNSVFENVFLDFHVGAGNTGAMDESGYPLHLLSQNNTFWNSQFQIGTSTNGVEISDCTFISHTNSHPWLQMTSYPTSSNTGNNTLNGNNFLCQGENSKGCTTQNVVVASNTTSLITNQLDTSYFRTPPELQYLKITDSGTLQTKLMNEPSFVCQFNRSIISISVKVYSNHLFIVNFTNYNYQQSIQARTVSDSDSGSISFSSFSPPSSLPPTPSPSYVASLDFSWNSSDPALVLQLNQSDFVSFALKLVENYNTSSAIAFLTPFNASIFDQSQIEIEYGYSRGYYLPHCPQEVPSFSWSTGIIPFVLIMYDEWGLQSTTETLRNVPKLTSAQLGDQELTNPDTRIFWNPVPFDGISSMVVIQIDNEPELTITVISSWWVFGIVIGIVSAIALSIFILKLRRYRVRLTEKQQLIEQQGQEIQLMTDVWKIQPEELEWQEKLAAGGFGEVWKCEWRETTVAVKQLLKHWIELDRETSTCGFEEEVKLLRTIRHQNIVLFYGAGVLEDGSPFLVTEFLARGSLFSILQSDQEQFGWVQKVKFCLDAAQGMKFLHSSEPALIHRDLKPHNLLVTKQLRVKIADFGTAKLMASSSTKKARHLQNQTELTDSTDSISSSSSQMKSWAAGTIPYLAPELLQLGLSWNEENTDKEGDVFSFGITMWTIAEEKEPYSSLTPTEIEELVTGGGRPEVSRPGCPADWVELMKSCWHQSPTGRPSFNSIVLILKSILLGLEEDEHNLQ